MISFRLFSYYLTLVYLVHISSRNSHTLATEQICCCQYHNLDNYTTITSMTMRTSLVNGYYVCQRMEVSPFWQAMRSMTTLKCNAIEDEPFNRYVYNTIYIIDCVVDFANVKHFRNIKHLEANGSRLINVSAAWKKGGSRNILSVRFAHNNLTEMIDFSSMRFGDLVDLSDNQIEYLNGTRPWFSASTRIIFLQNNRIKFVHPLSFSYLYDLLELNLANNLIKQFGIVFDLSAAHSLVVNVNLSRNPRLEEITNLTIRGRSDQETQVFTLDTGLRSIVEANLTNTSVLIFSTLKKQQQMKHDQNLVGNVTFKSSFLNNTQRIDQVLAMNNGLKIKRLEQASLAGMNSSFVKVLMLSGNGFDELPFVDELDIRELHLDRNLVRELISPAYLPRTLETLNLERNLIEFVDERFFVRFDGLKQVLLRHNRLHAIESIYLASNRLQIVDLSFNEMEILNRFVFTNQLDSQKETTSNSSRLVINLSMNYLTRLPRFYGNITEIYRLIMAMQKNTSLVQLEDRFFDNSMPFDETSNNKNDNEIKPSRVQINELYMFYSYTSSFSRDVFCLNEKNLAANLVPRYLEMGSNPLLSCHFLCHLYLQLRLERKMRVRFNDNCVGDHGTLSENKLNKDKLEFVEPSKYALQSNTRFRFNESDCQPFERYSCDYSPSLLTHLPDWEKIPKFRNESMLSGMMSTTKWAFKSTTKTTTTTSTTTTRKSLSNQKVDYNNERRLSSSLTRQNNSNSRIYHQKILNLLLIFLVLIHDKLFVYTF